ncbi:hypothetical protein LPJ70_006437, partial [Coemansia sp. RSA 2708]
VLASTTSARFMTPEDIDRNAAEARGHRQAQCGGLRPGSLEYNQCMAHWTDNVLNCYPEDQHLIPRQEAERMSEADHAEAFRGEVNRLSQPETEHYVAGGNQRFAEPRRVRHNDERMVPNDVAEEQQPAQVERTQPRRMEQPHEFEQQRQEQRPEQRPEQHQGQRPEQRQEEHQEHRQEQHHPAPVRKGRTIRTTLSGKQAPVRQATEPAATPVITPIATAESTSVVAATVHAEPAVVIAPKAAQPPSPQKAVQAEEADDEDDESDAPAIAQTVVQPNVVVSGTAVAAPAATLSPAAPAAATAAAAVAPAANATVAATTPVAVKQVTAAAESLASAVAQPATQ